MRVISSAAQVEESEGGDGGEGRGERVSAIGPVRVVAAHHSRAASPKGSERPGSHSPSISHHHQHIIRCLLSSSHLNLFQQFHIIVDLIDINSIQQQWVSRRPGHDAFWKFIHIILHQPNQLGILLDNEVRQEAHIHALHAQLTPLIVSQNEELLVEFEHLTIRPLTFHLMQLDEA